MTNAAHQTLTRYVKNGGTLFLSVHHFNTNPVPDQPPASFNNGNLTELAGITLKTRAPLIRVQRIQDVPNDIVSLPHKSYPGLSAFPITTHKNVTILALDPKTKSPLLIAHRLGKGRVICYTGQTPMGNLQVRPFVDDVIQSLARTARPEIHLTNDAPIYLQQYRLNNVTQLFLLNINWKFPNHIERADLAIAGKTFPIDVPGGAPTILYHLPTVTVFAASPLTQIYELCADPHAVAFTAGGKNLETFTLLAHRPVRRILLGAREIPFFHLPYRPDILQFSCDLTRPQPITVEH